MTPRFPPIDYQISNLLAVKNRIVLMTRGHREKTALPADIE